MPLRKGKSKEDISENIRTEMHHGKPQRQAIAIAMRVAGKSRRKKHAAAMSLSEARRQAVVKEFLSNL